MAYSPKDLALNQWEIREADEVEKLIDKDLKACYVQGGQPIPVRIKTVSSRVKGELIRRYKEVGWSKVEVAILDSNTLIFFQ